MYHSRGIAVEEELDAVVAQLGGHNLTPLAILAREQVFELGHRHLVDIAVLVDDDGHCIDSNHATAIGPALTSKYGALLVGQVGRGNDEVDLLVKQRVECSPLAHVARLDEGTGILILKHVDFLLKHVLKRLVAVYLGHALGGAVGTVAILLARYKHSRGDTRKEQCAKQYFKILFHCRVLFLSILQLCDGHRSRHRRHACR